MNKKNKQEVKDRYKEYVLKEFDEKLDTVEDVLGLMYTTVGDDYDLQVSYDLDKEEIIITIDAGEDRYTYKDKLSLDDFYEELESATFEGYYSYAHDIVENELGLKDIEF